MRLLPLILGLTLCSTFSGSAFRLNSPALERNPIWQQFQPKLDRLVDSFERVCRSQDAQFDRSATESELSTCFGPPMEQLAEIVTARDDGASLQLVTIVEKLKASPSDKGTRSKAPRARELTRTEIQLLRVHMVEPICFFTGHILDCFSPHYNRIIDQCTSDPEGAAMQYSDQIVIAACKQNGSRLIDFLESGGIECVEPYITAAVECLQKQSMSFSDSMDLLKYGRRPDSLAELCLDLSEMHSCLTASLSACQRAEPARLMREALLEVQKWATTTCSSSGRSRNKAHFRSSSSRNGGGQEIQTFIGIILILCAHLFTN